MVPFSQPLFLLMTICEDHVLTSLSPLLRMRLQTSVPWGPARPWGGLRAAGDEEVAKSKEQLEHSEEHHPHLTQLSVPARDTAQDPHLHPPAQSHQRRPQTTTEGSQLSILSSEIQGTSLPILLVLGNSMAS